MRRKNDWEKKKGNLIKNELLSEPLASAGYEVTAASDGLEGINTFHSHNFDLVLLDIMLPKIRAGFPDKFYQLCAPMKRFVKCFFEY